MLFDLIWHVHPEKQTCHHSYQVKAQDSKNNPNQSEESNSPGNDDCTCEGKTKFTPSFEHAHDDESHQRRFKDQIHVGKHLVFENFVLEEAFQEKKIKPALDDQEKHHLNRSDRLCRYKHGFYKYSFDYKRDIEIAT